MNILVTILILSFFHPTCLSYRSEQKGGGFCLITTTSREPKWETYPVTFLSHRQERCGWRYCRKAFIDTKQENRLVYRDVEKTSVECCEGYQKTQVHGNVYNCEPVCEPACVKGHCVGVGNCTCYHGYEHVTSNECRPSCYPQCEGGTCIAPQTCDCLEGYRRVNSSYCEPICSPSCVNGLCTAPDVCTCKLGFHKNSTEPNICEPSCADDCINSVCVGYDECACLQGFKKVLDKPNTCLPFCSLECIHGECTAPDTCSCENGYKLSNTSWNNCVPSCNCSNGYCLEPNECTCFENYALNEEGNCDPVCDNCINATCTSPYVCECFSGFKNVSDNVCEPECSDCQNGICTEPEVCTCFEGYQDYQGTCEPVCTHGCANGACVAPEKCDCVNDVEQVEDNICFPVCGNNCTNCSFSDNCLQPKRTQMDITYSQTSISLKAKFHLDVNCSALMAMKSLCDVNSTKEANCTSLNVECSPIKTNQGSWKFFCILRYQNDTNEDLYSEILSDVSLVDIKSVDQKVDATLLFPEMLSDEEGCELCTDYSSTSSLPVSNRIFFNVSLCPATTMEEIKSVKDLNSILYIVIASTLAIIIVAAVGTAIWYIMLRHRVHDYIVNKRRDYKECKEIEDDDYEEIDHDIQETKQ